MQKRLVLALVLFNYGFLFLVSSFLMSQILSQPLLENDTALLQKYFDKAVSKQSHVINLNKSIYKVTNSLFLNNAKNLIINAQGSLFLNSSTNSFVILNNSSNITFANICIKYKQSPSFFVTIVSSGLFGKVLDVESTLPFEGFIQGLMLFKKPFLRPSYPDLYLKENPAFIKHISGKSYRISNLPANKFKVGNTLALRPIISGRPAFRFVNCSSIFIDNIKISESPGMGMLFDSCTDIFIKDLHVEPNSDYKLSSNTDALHFARCRGIIEIQSSVFERMGDDAINVHGTYGRLDEVLNTNTIQYVTGRSDVDWPAPAAKTGDVVSIHHPTNPFGKPVVQGVVLSSQSGSDDKSLQITLDSPVSKDLPKDSVVWNQSTSPSLVVTKCRFLNNRARGVLIQSSNARIEDNWFQGMTGPAIKVTCDVGRWWESGPSTNIVIRNNFISDCNDGPGSAQGAVTVNADAPGLKSIAGVHRNIEISGNRIRDVGGLGIFVSSAANVRIFQNRLSTTNPPFILTKDSADVVILDNTTKDSTTSNHPPKSSQ